MRCLSKMAKKNVIGIWAFIIAIFGSLILGLLVSLGLFEASVTVTVILLIDGIITGLLSIPKEKASTVIVIAMILGIGAGVFAVLPLVGEFIDAMLVSLASVMIPAGITLGVKTLFLMRR